MCCKLFWASGVFAFTRLTTADESPPGARFASYQVVHRNLPAGELDPHVEVGRGGVLTDRLALQEELKPRVAPLDVKPRSAKAHLRHRAVELWRCRPSL